MDRFKNVTDIFKKRPTDGRPSNPTMAKERKTDDEDANVTLLKERTSTSAKRAPVEELRNKEETKKGKMDFVGESDANTMKDDSIANARASRKRKTEGKHFRTTQASLVIQKKDKRRSQFSDSQPVFTSDRDDGYSTPIFMSQDNEPGKWNVEDGSEESEGSCRSSAVQQRRQSQTRKGRETSLRSRDRSSYFCWNDWSQASLKKMKETVTSLAKFCYEETKATRLRVHKQLTSEILGPANMDVYEKAKRQLCRMPFHTKKDDEKDYVTLETLYPALYREFIGISNPEPASPFIKSSEQLKNAKTAIVEEEVDDDEEGKVEDEYDDVHEAEEFVYGVPTVAFVHETLGNVLQKCTVGRRCDEDCQVLDNLEAFAVHQAIMAHLLATPRTSFELRPQNIEYSWKGNTEKVENFLAKYSMCFQGLRTLKRRFDEIEKLVDLFDSCRTALVDDELVDLRKQLFSLEDLSDELREKFANQHLPAPTQEHHSEGVVKKRYADMMRKFKEAVELQDTEPCDVCGILTIPTEISFPAPQKYAHLMTPQMKRLNRRIQVCRKCRRGVGPNNDGVPAAAAINNFEVKRVPQELQDLNYIETALIQLVRPNMRVFHLTNIGNKKTAVKATNGILVVLPTDIKSTVEHVLKTLPSTSNMVIHVRTSWNAALLVRMKKVLCALKWLKKNNPLYSSIEIDEKFKLTIGENVVFDNEDATQKDADGLISRWTSKKDDDEDDDDDDDDDDDGHLLTQDFLAVEEQPIQQVRQERDAETAEAKYLLKKHVWTPLSVDTPHIDAMAFPKLHPYGTDGFSGNRPKKPIKLPQYRRARMFHKDVRWASDSTWLCFMYGLKQQQALTSVQGTQSRIQAHTQLKDFDLSDERVKAKLSSAYKKIPGYPAYCKTVKYELRAQCATLGTPSWFITLNPNTKGWTDLHRLYEKVLGLDEDDVNEKNIDEHIGKYPVIFSRYFRRRFHAFVKHVLLAEDCPLGTVTHYFFRKEYQHRGTQHMHGLLWTKERPSNDASALELENYLDKYITCRQPDMVEEPNLYKAVQEQKHWEKHSKTCLRKWGRGRLRKSVCRFGFPRNVKARTVVSKEKTKFRIAGVSQRWYQLMRRENERLINDYSPAISLMWNANVDVQAMCEGVKTTCNYITAYTTKSEKAAMHIDETRYTIPGQSRSKALAAYALDLMRSREVGTMEIVDNLAGFKMFESGMDCVFINIDASNKRIRMLKPASQLTQENTIVTVTNMVDNYYPDRPRSLEPYSLYNIMINFDVTSAGEDPKARKKTKKDVKKGKDEEESQNEDGSEKSDDEAEVLPYLNILDEEYHTENQLSPFFKHTELFIGDLIQLEEYGNKKLRKTKQKIGRFYLPKVIEGDAESLNDRYRRLCMLFIPWRVEDEFLTKFKVETFAEAWKSYLNVLEKKDHLALEDIRKLLSRYMDLEKEEAEMAERIELSKKALLELAKDEEDEEEERIELQDRVVDIERHKKDVAALNTCQKEIFKLIMKTIAEQEKTKSENKKVEEYNATVPKRSYRPLKPMPDPIQMFVSGTAGTGKSFLINVLADALTVAYVSEKDTITKPAVLIAAPTGIAALSVNGNTLHSLFQIPVTTEENRAEVFPEIPAKKFDDVKFLFTNVKLIIVDEISMVSNVMLVKVHERCRDISGRCLPFGGYNILVLGDLLQLPPVLERPVYEAVRQSTMRQIFGSAFINLNLWKCFEYRELTENMRQGDDLQFAQLLTRVRCGQQTDKDVAVFESCRIPCANVERPTMREIAKYLLDLREGNAKTMALFSTNTEVDTFNECVLEMLKLNVTVIDADDTVDEASMDACRRLKPKGFPKIWQKFKIDATKDNEKNKKKGDNGNENDENEKRAEQQRLLSSTARDTKLHGGLPARIRVAIGARIMLRRNIDIRRRLVNGATGFVTAFQPNAKKPETIWVEFDGNPPFQHGLTRMEARYTRANDEIMLRRQFPFVVAFAATIHKAQGLTLQDVIISSENIFKSGMFYVAASRVTTMSGLHLAGFNASKILTDDSALHEANELRASINLPDVEEECARTLARYGGPSQLKRQTTQKVVVKQKDQDDDDDDDEEFDDDDEDSQQSTVPSLTSTQKRAQRVVYEYARNDKDLIDMVIRIVPSKHLNYDQRNTEVVMTVLIHALNMMEFVRETLLSNDEKVQDDRSAHPFAFMLIKMYLQNNGRSTDLWQIVEEGLSSELETMKQIVHFVLKEVIPPVANQQYQQHCEYTTKCVQCKNVEHGITWAPVIWLSRTETSGKIHEVIDVHCDKWRKTDEVCTKLVGKENKECGGNLAKRQTVGDGAKYLLVAQPYATMNDTQCFQTPQMDPVKIGSRRFILIGVISSSEQWYRSPERGWLRCYIDNDVGKFRSELTRTVHMKGAMFFIFVEKPLMRLSDAQKRRHQNVDEKICDEFQDILNMDDADKDDIDDESESDQINNSFGVAEPMDWGPVNAIVEVMEQQKPVHVSQKPFLLLSNNGDDCFLNSAVNILYNSEAIRRLISQRPLTTVQTDIGQVVLMDALTKLFKRSVDNVATLRTVLPEMFKRGRNDASSVFEAVVEEIASFDPSILRDISFQLFTRFTCRSCGNHEELSKRFYSRLILRKHASFQELFDQHWESKDAESCLRCETGLMHRTQRALTGSHHIMIIDRVQEETTFFLDVNSSVEMFGHEWMAQALSQFKPGRGGHYLTWVKEEGDDGNWLCIDDNWISRQQTTLDTSQMNITMLMFRKIE